MTAVDLFCCFCLTMRKIQRVVFCVSEHRFGKQTDKAAFFMIGVLGYKKDIDKVLAETLLKPFYFQNEDCVDLFDASR